MWSLLTVASLISALGTTRGLSEIAASQDPEVTMNISQIISYWGYPNEEYEVVTEDGYILQIYRIPHGKKNSGSIDKKPVVFLQHGLLTSAINWIFNLPNNSLAFILADAGYDVWLGNSRGNTWAMKNVHYSPDSVEFWAFSFDEMAKYDLPSTIDFIVKKTGQEKLDYVGHSQGTTTAFIAFSTNPKLAERIKTFYALAPVATVKYAKGLLRVLLSIPSLLFRAIFGNKMFSPHNHFYELTATQICSREISNSLCSNTLFLVAGFNTKNMNMSRLDVYISHNPAGTSVQNMLHWSQAAKSGKFQAFDWGGPTKNMIHYNQPTPPLYKVTDMQVPIAAWTGGNDWLADPRDVAILLPQLSHLVYHKNIPAYNHLDFIWGMDAPQEIYSEVLSLMAKDKK